MAANDKQQIVKKQPANAADSKKSDSKKNGQTGDNAVVRFFKRIGKAFYNMYHELKKVTWPTKSALINYSLVVFAFLVIMGVIIGLFDLGAGKLVQLITG